MAGNTACFVSLFTFIYVCTSARSLYWKHSRPKDRNRRILLIVSFLRLFAEAPVPNTHGE